MKVLTAAQMREVDRRTAELGIPLLILMENAGYRVVEFLAETFSPLAEQRIVILCGKGNNGGDGLAVARLLRTRIRPAELHVVLAAEPAELKGDAAANYRMLAAHHVPVARSIAPETCTATIVVDGLLGTGLKGPASGEMLELIRQINTRFPLARIVSIDIPSGLASDSGAPLGESVRAHYTVTLTAPKPGLVLPPNCEQAGKLQVAPIGSPPELFENDDSIWLSLVESSDFSRLLAPRPRSAHKGDFGHVLVVGGSRGKTGAAAMAGLAALRAGAGLVTVASAESAIGVIATHAPEMMTEPLPETDTGAISLRAFDYNRLSQLAENKDVLAVGPGLGTHPDTAGVVRRLLSEFPHPMVIDADGLNALAGADFRGAGRLRVLTPHPGEMARLTAKSTQDVLADRVAVARAFVLERGVVLVLKGYCTLIAFPDGRVRINPTGTPAMASGGAGDILTGMLAGFLAQFPADAEAAITAAVFLHGLAGELGADELGEKPLLATDLLASLPEAIHACAGLRNRL